ncbi:MAG: hypothetical protein IPJ14_14495 [Kineosporiaceae bacterium]|nr:hypothetical protein [Kineosporiaceae bacterium]
MEDHRQDADPRGDEQTEHEVGQARAKTGGRVQACREALFCSSFHLRDEQDAGDDCRDTDQDESDPGVSSAKNTRHAPWVQ